MRFDINMKNLYMVEVYDMDDNLVYLNCVECDDINRLKTWLENCYNGTGGYAEISHMQLQELPSYELNF